MHVMSSCAINLQGNEGDEHLLRSRQCLCTLAVEPRITNHSNLLCFPRHQRDMGTKPRRFLCLSVLTRPGLKGYRTQFEYNMHVPSPVAKLKGSPPILFHHQICPKGVCSCQNSFYNVHLVTGKSGSNQVHCQGALDISSHTAMLRICQPPVEFSSCAQSGSWKALVWSFGKLSTSLSTYTNVYAFLSNSSRPSSRWSSLRRFFHHQPLSQQLVVFPLPGWIFSRSES